MTKVDDPGGPGRQVGGRSTDKFTVKESVGSCLILNNVWACRGALKEKLCRNT